jgi:plastocyanin
MFGGGGRRLAPLTAAAAALAVALSGCQLKDDGDNLVAGKTAFVQKCGACHVLKRAGTTGVSGPDLDAAFAQSRRDGFGESTFAGVVLQQIKHPSRTSQRDPVTQKAVTSMPADLVKGETAEDVAAYVASAVAKGGDDPGRLADVGAKRSTDVADVSGGENDIEADPNGQLAYVFGAATAKPGKLTLLSTNKSSIDHNIAIEGGGLDEKGPVVKNGGVSRISFEAKKGEYTFYCSVPGHREGGMLGKLTVE